MSRRQRDPLAGDLDLLLERVYAYVAYRIGPGAEAEDVTGEVFERALRYRQTFDPDRGVPIAWLIGIARSRLAEPRRTFDPPPGVAVLPPASFEDASLDRLALEDAFRSLSPRDRELVALRYGAELTGEQIAAVVGMSANAAAVALHRALARLRTELQADEPEAPAQA